MDDAHLRASARRRLCACLTLTYENCHEVFLPACTKPALFLEQNPDIEMFELFILDNNGVPRGKLLHRDELLAVYESGAPAAQHDPWPDHPWR